MFYFYYLKQSRSTKTKNLKNIHYGIFSSIFVFIVEKNIYYFKDFWHLKNHLEI